MPVIKDVLIGLPCYDNRIDVDIYEECLAAIADPECVVAGIQHYNGDSLIPRGRNKIAKMFLDSPYKYLMFIDSDIKFNRAHINRLRSHNKQIIGGVYLKKTIPYAPVMNSPIAREGDLVVMREIGTGFMMIRRDVFGQFREMWPEHHYRADHDEAQGLYYDYFRTGVFRFDGEKPTEAGRYLSEDYSFCQLAGTLGIKTYLDTAIMVQHIGRMLYPTDDKRFLEGAAVLMESMIPTAPMDTNILMRVENAAKSQRERRSPQGMVTPNGTYNVATETTRIPLPIPEPYTAKSFTHNTSSDQPDTEKLMEAVV